MTLHPPLEFSGKTVTVTYQVLTDNGLMPYSVANEDEEEAGPSYPVAVLIHHFQRCYVRKIVRLFFEKPNWILTDKGLEDPAAEPWFLVRAFMNSTPLHFLVNGDLQFYPLLSKPGGELTPEPALDKLALLPPEYWKQTTDWTDFSAADKATVEAAIQAFLHRYGLK